MTFKKVFPIKTLKGMTPTSFDPFSSLIHKNFDFFNKIDDDFLHSTHIASKFWFIIMATTIVRFKYYFAWLAADAICNCSGLGFNGYDEIGSPKWDLISNINVIPFEVTSKSLPLSCSIDFKFRFSLV